MKFTVSTQTLSTSLNSSWEKVHRDPLTFNSTISLEFSDITLLFGHDRIITMAHQISLFFVFLQVSRFKQSKNDFFREKALITVYPSIVR